MGKSFAFPVMKCWKDLNMVFHFHPYGIEVDIDVI